MIRKQYVREVRKDKTGSWEKFVSKERNENPWGIIYKTLTKKLRIDRVLSNITSQNTQTTTWKQTAATLLNGLILNDNLSGESPQQKGICNIIKAPLQTEGRTLFTEQEINEIKNTINQGSPRQRSDRGRGHKTKHGRR